MPKELYKPKTIDVEVYKFTGGRENAWEVMDWVRRDHLKANWFNNGSSQTITVDRGDDYIVMNLNDYLVKDWEGKYEHFTPIEFHKKYEPSKASE